MSHDPTDLSAFNCVDCGTNTCHGDEYYMVHSHVWREEAGMECLGGMLCIGCLESRILRRLKPEDFTDAPINYIFRQSPRLASRLKGKTHPGMEIAA